MGIDLGCANPTSIQCQSGANWIDVDPRSIGCPTRTTNLLLNCQSWFNLPIQSLAILPFYYKSTNLEPIHHKYANFKQIHPHSANQNSITKSNDNLPILDQDANPIPILNKSANLHSIS